MRIHRLIPLLMVLIVLALTTMITITQSPIAVESGTATAQAVEGEAEEEPTEAEGVSTFPLTETKEETGVDLYLDAAKVERLAAEEQKRRQTNYLPQRGSAFVQARGACGTGRPGSRRRRSVHQKLRHWSD